jgi:hypothetical protein
MTANSEGRGLVAIGRRRTYPHPREGVAWPRHRRHLITSRWTFVFESNGTPRSEQRSYKYPL